MLCNFGRSVITIGIKQCKFKSILLRTAHRNISNELSWSRYSNFITDTPSIFTDSLRIGEERIGFYDMTMYGWYHQLRHDLTTYYHVDTKEAKVMASRFAFFQRKNYSSIEHGVVFNAEPFYYATQLFFGTNYPSFHWQSVAATPADYEYCLGYKIFNAHRKESSQDFCVSKFNEFNEKSQNHITLHGSFQEFNIIDLSSASNTDFVSCSQRSRSDNKAYYVTNDRMQAGYWALRQARLLEVTTDSMVTYDKMGQLAAYIIKFIMNVSEVRDKFNWKNFDDYDEWNEFVIKSRNGNNDHNYDVVEGPFVMNPDAIGQRGGGDSSVYLVPWGHQIAFCNENVIKTSLKKYGVEFITDDDIDPFVEA